MKSKKQHRTKSSLPQDLIFAEILPKVSSIKSLLRFKCVSKSWSSFLSTKKFAKTHLQKSVKNAQHKTLLISPTSLEEDNYVINQCSVSSLFSQKGRIKVAQLEFDYPMTNYRTKIVGCCNGLFCINIDSKYFVLWNPSTKKSHKLPPVLDDYLWIYLDGFGYANGDYKVLVRLTVSPAHRRGCCSFDYVFRLYSLKTNSWKTIDDFHGPGPFEGHGALVNGKLHWAMRTFIAPLSTEVGLNIVSFDLGSETGGVVEQPSFANGKFLYPNMCVLQGCLCVLCDTRNGSTDVWVMKEYGVKESWCKVANVLDIGERIYSFPQLPFSILSISEEGEVLLTKESSLIVYSPETLSDRHLQLKYISKLHQIGFYIESLVSPFPDE